MENTEQVKQIIRNNKDNNVFYNNKENTNKLSSDNIVIFNNQENLEINNTNNNNTKVVFRSIKCKGCFKHKYANSIDINKVVRPWSNWDKEEKVVFFTMISEYYESNFNNSRSIKNFNLKVLLNKIREVSILSIYNYYSLLIDFSN